MCSQYSAPTHTLTVFFLSCIRMTNNKCFIVCLINSEKCMYAVRDQHVDRREGTYTEEMSQLLTVVTDTQSWCL